MKDLIKSIFISTFNAVTALVFINSIITVTRVGFSFLSLGLIISSLTVIIYFAGLYIKPRARTSPFLKGYTITIIIGVLITIFSDQENSRVDILNILSIAILLLGWLLYIKWYSILEIKESKLLKVGNLLSYFELEDACKNKVSSDKFKGYYTIFIFYRGNWCPLCMAQIKEVAAHYKELEAKEIKTVLISPQPHHFSKKIAKKHNISFNFLTDNNNKVAKQLGINHKHGIPAGFQLLGYDSNTVLPTVIITDKNGTIIYVDQTDNYRIRPEPQDFLKVISKLTLE